MENNTVNEKSNSKNNNEKLDIDNENINSEAIENEKKNKKIRKKKKKDSFFRWPLFVLLLTLILSGLFSFVSEIVLSNANLIISIILLFVFIFIAMIFDMLGVAVTAAELEPFVAMSSKKIRGAKTAIVLVKNNAKISSVFCDIIGDICGILSGAVGTSILAYIVVQGSLLQILVASLISAIIAGLTVFLKSIGKKIAIKNSTKIILILAKFLSVFKREK